MHTGERPYTCPGCSRSFARMDALNRLYPHNTHLLIADIVNQGVNVLYITWLLDLNKTQLKDGCPYLLESEDPHLLKVPRHHFRKPLITRPISTSIPPWQQRVTATRTHPPTYHQNKNTTTTEISETRVQDFLRHQRVALVSVEVLRPQRLDLRVTVEVYSHPHS